MTPLKVLLVEDSDSDAGLVMRALRRGGFDPTFQRVETAQDMVAALESPDWNVVISDYNLPEFDAPSALNVLQAAKSDLPFIVVSGNIGEDSAVKLMKRGASDYILKDSLARLPAVVQRELAELETRRQLKRSESHLRLAAKVFESSREAIVITNAQRCIVSANRAFVEITGFQLDDVRDQSIALLNAANEDDEFLKNMWLDVAVHGFWQGEVTIKRKLGADFPTRLSITSVKDDLGQDQNYVLVATDITEHKQAAERINYLAHYDVLTDLPNRVSMQGRVAYILAQAKSAGTQVAILFVDLDRFKAINDSLGHHAGDMVLKGVASRLKSCMRAADVVSRLGGDEFVVVLPQTNEHGAKEVANKIREELSVPYVFDNQNLTVTPTIGISVYPEDGEDADTLIRNADSALYHAKDSGRNNYLFFTQRMNLAAIERMVLENGMRAALDRNEFVLHYQPQIELDTGTLVGFEALIRWQHPERGLLHPARFIPLAEESDLIIAMGNWVTREACRQNAEWQKAGLQAVPVSVNLSARQLVNRSLTKTVQTILSETGLAARYLELELTETMLMDSAGTPVNVIAELADHGVSFAIDDFGTGYSNLGYLRRFPIHRLKIDQSFVRGITQNQGDPAIVRAVLGLARNLNLKVLAEGIENVEQLEFLRAEGCDEIQGYLIGKPLPAEEFAKVLASTAPLIDLSAAQPIAQRHDSIAARNSMRAKAS
jgi:diguanylate cyclase (GGDEF)-like protein/PAS domain S-box-containing protein